MYNCPLCQSASSKAFYSHFLKALDQQRPRNFFICGDCKLIYLDRNLILNSSEEKERYLTHNNNLEDAAYINFIKKLWKPLKAQLSVPSCGLDFGCGPVSVIQHLVKSDLKSEADQFQINCYDPYFFNEPKVLQESYDFIFCSEAIEHFNDPLKELKLWQKLLKPGGVLGIMTETYSDNIDFSQWHYPRDPTHINFFQIETFKWISKHYHWVMEAVSSRVVLFKKHQISS